MTTIKPLAPVTLPRLACKPDLELCLKRIEAWYHGAVLDRPPVRFTKHNAQHDAGHPLDTTRWRSLRDRWHDIDYALDRFESSIEGKIFRGETFPVYIPSLGPNVYSSFYGGELEFGETTTWYEPVIKNLDDLSALNDKPFESAPFRFLEAQTRAALQRCGDRYWVGYADLHPSLDCVAAWYGSEPLMYGMADEPEKLAPLLDLSVRDFQAIFNHFHAMLQAGGQPSLTWLRVPCAGGKFHIPSGDATSMISSGYFRQFSQPLLDRELEGMDRVIYHMDGKGVAQHLDLILEEPRIHGIQWVQGVGDDWPILQWLPLIKRMLEGGKSVIVDVPLGELDEFMSRLPREGLFLCLATTDDREEELLRRVEKWQSAS